MDKINLTIDGKTVSVPKGTNLIEAAKLAGIEIPHYCYHPKLSVAGNCRMCLVEVGMPKRGADRNIELDDKGQPVILFAPKPAIGCNTTADEGMVVKTQSGKVVDARKGVMEFLLINHPLDCPICDQAGECRLQEYSADYGQSQSRFIEEKEHKPKQVALGPKVTLDDERCIECSRCIRFMKEVAGQDCLGFVNRGSRSTLSCYPGQEPNTNYDLNIVDLCPVGALTSNDFRFKQRVWFLKETSTVCTSCARGCNVTLSSREDKIYRFTPRLNEDVNQYWMCDYGRLNYKYIHDPARLTQPQIKTGNSLQAVSWNQALKQTADLLTGLPAGSLAAIGSARLTLEEQYLFGALLKILSCNLVDCLPRLGAPDNFLLQADYSPNLAGAHLTGLVSQSAPGEKLPQIAEGIKTGKIQGLIVLSDNPESAGLSSELLSQLQVLIIIDILPNSSQTYAHVLLPGAAFPEKQGTLLNFQGRLQKSEQAIQGPGEARPEWQILSQLLKLLNGPHFTSPGEVFKQMALEFPFLSGLSYSRLGSLGHVVLNPSDQRQG